MDTPLERLRHAVRQIEAEVNMLVEDEMALTESVRHIDIDLSNSLAEYVATTGRPAAGFYKWRKGAKWARYHKVRSLERKQDEVRGAKQRLADAQMLLYAHESGYRGQDEVELLRALYHLVMEVLQYSQYRVDEHQLGLIAAVRDRTEHHTMKEVI